MKIHFFTSSYMYSLRDCDGSSVSNYVQLSIFLDQRNIEYNKRNLLLLLEINYSALYWPFAVDSAFYLLIQFYLSIRHTYFELFVL